jgi:hypothetical protein
LPGETNIVEISRMDAELINFETIKTRQNVIPFFSSVYRPVDFWAPSAAG